MPENGYGLINWLKAGERLVNLENEINACVEELNKLVPSISPIDDRPFDLVELYTLLDHIENMAKGRPAEARRGDQRSRAIPTGLGSEAR